jgi:hypothetical protein
MGPVDRSAGILVSILLRLFNARLERQLTCRQGGPAATRGDEPPGAWCNALTYAYSARPY